MKKLLGLLIALAAMSASADAIFENKDVKLILRDEAGCPSPVKELINPDILGRMHPAEITYQGHKLRACWLEEQGQIVVIDEDGDGGVLPKEALKPYNGV